MSLRKVTFFDRPGRSLCDVDEEGQAKPSVFGVNWVNLDTFKTIRVRGGVRTDPFGNPISDVAPTVSTSPFDVGGPFLEGRRDRK
jgi:hypothetical protein